MRYNVSTKIAGLSATVLLMAIFVMSSAKPAYAAVGGTVTCDAYSPSYPVVGIWIDSSNNAHDGWASWSPVPGQPWKATFSKSDVNESYKVHVGCGGDKNNWGQSSYSGWVTGHNDFICHVSWVANQRVCNS